MSTSGAEREPKLVIDELTKIVDSNDFDDLSGRSMVELRSVRDSLVEIESALSFGRRMAQGRLDILFAEAERRVSGGEQTSSDLVAELPDLLSKGARGTGNPRPVRDIEMSTLALQVLDMIDTMIPTSEMGSINEIEPFRLSEITERMTAFERSISEQRHAVHRLIDTVQAEIIDRYRSGAESVDDLLT